MRATQTSPHKLRAIPDTLTKLFSLKGIRTRTLKKVQSASNTSSESPALPKTSSLFWINGLKNSGKSFGEKEMFFQRNDNLSS